MEKLTNVEELMMRCIWGYGDEMPFLQMGGELKEKSHKDYKRTSIRTYLFRLEDKGYIKVEKKGRKAYIYTLISKEEYKKEKAADMLEIWFDGSTRELLSALGEKVPTEEKKELTDMLEKMELEQNICD